MIFGIDAYFTVGLGVTGLGYTVVLVDTFVGFVVEVVFDLVVFVVAGVLVGPPKTNHTSVVKTKSLNEAISIFKFRIRAF